EHHRRLMRVVHLRLGHELAARAEAAKIAVAGGADTHIDLGHVEPELQVRLGEAQAMDALEDDMARIVDAALATTTQAGVAASGVGALYFTGGSTGLRALTARLAAAFPAARAVHGDRFASVATGLGLRASRLFGGS
ncbi:MAG TPA: heat-shock protein, partial [Methylibium sp.]